MTEKKQKRRGIIVAVTGFILAFAAQLAGVAAGVKLAEYKPLFIALAAVSGVLVVLAVVANIVLANRYNERANEMSVEERQAFLAAHREQAEHTAAEKLRRITKIKRCTAVYAVALGLFGLTFAFGTGALTSSSLAYLVVALSAYLVIGALARIPMRITDDVLEDPDSRRDLISEEDYPRLYALAKKAAAATGCSYRIQLSVLVVDYNAAIVKLGNTCVVALGAMLVGTLSEEELYNVLLHEFAHLKPNRAYEKHVSYYAWISSNILCVPNYTLMKYMYQYPDSVYYFESFLYQYAVSVQNETEADLAMAKHGDKNTAVSALLRLKYYELFEWEEGTYDFPCRLESEENTQTLYQRLDAFNARVKLRAPFWNSLVDKELLSRSASHPTLKMRMETLGVDKAQLVAATPNPVYIAEAEKLLAFANQVFCTKVAEKYKEARENLYLKPKARVEEWENAGKPITAEGYADIVEDLRTLGRCIEANELCRQAMDSLSDTAASNARFMYGAFLLHSFNSEGIEHLYKAVDENHNKVEEALEMIGMYCCMVGDEEGLERYRKECAERLQFMEDVYEKTGYINSSDTLVTEQLPDGMLEDILSYLHSIDGGRTERVYLVNKPITEGFSTSAFVLRLDVDTPTEESEDIYHKMFCYLDTRFDHQFSLFDVSDVPMKKIEAVKNSLVYQKEETLK